MPKQADSLRELAQVRADNRALLNAIVGNQGTALGRRNYMPDGVPDGDPCIIVYVPHKLHKAFLAKKLLVPKSLYSRDRSLKAATDVVVTTVHSQPKGAPVLSDDNKALVQRLQWLDGQLDVLVPGAQLGGYNIDQHGRIDAYCGTLGCCVTSKDGGSVGFLTNQHVGGTAGQSMYVPGGNQATIRHRRH